MKTSILTCFVSLAMLGGCASMDVPDLKSITEMPEFAEEAKNISDYPDPTLAPEMPDDVKNDKYWDKAARAIMRKRDAIGTPEDPSGGKTDSQIAQEMADLKAKVNEYKLDDPQ